MEDILNKQSGAWGVSGVSTDFRDIEREAAKGDERSILALESRAYIIAQYIAKFVVTLGGVDAITFAGGIGENGMEERERITGRTNFTFKKMLSLWINGFTAFSIKPLRISTVIGIITAKTRRLRPVNAPHLIDNARFQRIVYRLRRGQQP